MKIRAQFWDGWGDATVDAVVPPGASADQVAAYLIHVAKIHFASEWWSRQRGRMICARLEDRDTGRVVHGNYVP